jgi:hypothetical protein
MEKTLGTPQESLDTLGKCDTALLEYDEFEEVRLICQRCKSKSRESRSLVFSWLLSLGSLIALLFTLMKTHNNESSIYWRSLEFGTYNLFILLDSI